MKRKCFDKEFSYVVPIITCDFCKVHIKPGDRIYSVILTWGNGKMTCKECYDMFEISSWPIIIEKKINEEEDFIKEDEMKI